MKKISIVMSAAVCLFALSAEAQVKYILDTDIASDCDDAGAVAMLHALADRGEVDLLAMMVSTGGDYGAPALDAMNTYYRRPNIPIGTLKDSTFWVGGGYDEPTSSANFEKYNRYIAEHYPNDLKTGKNAPDATALYRRILAAQPDRSVVINSVGALINLDRLLKSGADQYSSLSGSALVARKVRMLVVAGGKNPTGSSSNFSKGVAERYTKPVIDNWPTRMVFVGNEVGGLVDTGYLTNTSQTTNNPARKAYEIYFGSNTRRRPSWDQVAALYAVRGLRNYFSINESGRQTADTKGYNTWVSADGGKDHAYITRIMDRYDMGELIEALMTAAPRGGSTTPTPTPAPTATPRPSNGLAPGLVATYYSDIQLINEVRSAIVSTVNQNFGAGSPASGVPSDRFSIAYEGYFLPLHGAGMKDYEFIVSVNDGARLFINGQRVINVWQDGPLKEARGTISLMAGQYHPIRVEYYDNTSGAQIQLRVRASGLTEAVVPSGRLFHDDN